jgi:hypothetical protein
VFAFLKLRSQTLFLHRIPNCSFATAWTFEVTDRELNREGKLSHPSDQYLYVDLSGALDKEKVQVFAIRADNNEKILAGGKLHIKRSAHKINLAAPRFYTLTKNEDSEFIAEEVTDRFSCSSPYDCAY